MRIDYVVKGLFRGQVWPHKSVINHSIFLREGTYSCTCLRAVLRILPVAFRGSAGTITTFRGTL
jgi:hypothetical protein